MSEDLRPIAEILVPMDFSPCAVNALAFAKRIAAAGGSRLHLLSVDDDPLLLQQMTDQSFRDDHENKMAFKLVELMPPDQHERFRSVTSVRLGTAHYEIEVYCKENEIDLIVMGNVGHSPITDALFGSVTAHVIRHAVCPVLSVRYSSAG